MNDSKGLYDIITADDKTKKQLALGALNWYGTFLIWKGIWQIISWPYNRWCIRKYLKDENVEYTINTYHWLP